MTDFSRYIVSNGRTNKMRVHKLDNLEADIVWEAANLCPDPSTSLLFGVPLDDEDTASALVLCAIAQLDAAGKLDGLDSLADPYGMSVISNEWSE